MLSRPGPLPTQELKKEGRDHGLCELCASRGKIFGLSQYRWRRTHENNMSVKAIAPILRSIRKCSIKSPVQSDAKKFIGQTPTSFVHDGWANARTPFSVTNRWLFTVKAVVFLAIPFWAPFMVVEYQLKKANQ